MAPRGTQDVVGQVRANERAEQSREACELQHRGTARFSFGAAAQGSIQVRQARGRCRKAQRLCQPVAADAGLMQRPVVQGVKAFLTNDLHQAHRQGLPHRAGDLTGGLRTLVDQAFYAQGVAHQRVGGHGQWVNGPHLR